MNCRPGDLAVIVRSLLRPDAIGKIVQCKAFDPCPATGLAAWRLEASIGPTMGGRYPGDWILDNCLRPIRPGDISDEEVRDLYMPTTTKEPA